MANQTIPGLSSITTPSSAGLLWISDPNASPQDRSFTLASLRGWLAVIEAVAANTTHALFTKDTRLVCSTGCSTLDVTAGASWAGLRIDIVNKNVTAGITLSVTSGAATVVLGPGSVSLEWDGTAWHKIGGAAFTQVFTSGTAATWKAPWTGAYNIACTGAGGGGGGAKQTGGIGSNAGSGGAGGGTVAKRYFVVAGTTFTYSVGAAGTAGASTPSAGGNGGDTTATDGTTGITGGGGGGGPAASQTTVGDGGTPGTATGGDVNSPGQGGAPGLATSAAGVYLSSGQGGASARGGGAQGKASSTSGPINGAAGQNFGGGGSGGANAAINAGTWASTGGAGAPGLITIDF